MIKKISAIVLALLVTAYIAALLIPMDPIEQRPGTRLSGEKDETANPDWSVLEPREKIYIQTQPWYGIPHSITTLSLVVDGELYVPCGRCPTKMWPNNVARNPNVVVAVKGKLYDRRINRVTDREELMRVFASFGRQGDTNHPPADVYLYHLAAPADGASR